MNLDSMTIEQLAELRDKVIQTLSDKVAARQKELSSEAERLDALVTSKPSTSRPGPKRPERPVKYRDGENEWTGVGTKPAWAKLKGDTLESYKV
jgi:DNA-binding protein H-NS